VLTSLTAQHQAPRRLFFTSSTGVYGQSHGEWVDESSATAPTHFTGRILLEAERVAASSPIRATIVRLAGIYGPGRTRLIEGVRRGELGCHSGQPEWSNRIHRDDCAGLLAHLASLDEPESVYIGVDDEPTDRCTIYHWLADRLGVPSPHRQGAPADDASRRGAGKRCSNTRLRASGYRLTFPTFRDGYRRILEDGEPGATLP
jgi:nucleoside-diphosphate-sugar epimerase